MERSNSTRKGKRILDPSQDDEEEERPAAGKRPTLASVILESHKMDLLKLLEPDISRIVSEKVELAISRFCSPNITVRCSTKQIEGPYQRNLKLHFRSGLSLPLFTERKVAGEQGAAIQVVLLDATTGHVVISGPESSVKLDVVVLEGDFNNEDDEDWTQEEFESHVVKKREGKRPLLIGDLQVKLKEGVGTLGNLKFTDNSSWIRSKKFRIGLKVPSGHYEGIRIQEAKTDAFSVKDHRGELSKKHYPPKLDDEVWRLEKIAKDGQFHKRLQMAGICTVEDFLLLLRSDPKSLKLILGGGMTNKIWEALVDHAGQCISNGNYRADSGSYSLNVNADGVVKKAYNNEVHIVEYDGNTILNFDQPTTEIWRTPDDTFNKQASPQCSPIPIIPERPTMETGLPSGGTSCNENPTAGCSVLSQTLNSKFHLLFGATSSPLQNQPMGTSHQAQIMRNDGIVSLTPGSSHSSISGFLNEFPSNLPTNFTSNDDLPLLCEVVDPSMKEVGVGCNHDYLSQSFCTMSEGLPSYVEANINGYSFLSSVPSQQNCSQDEGRIHSSWKAVPQWLMLKGVVMWRIRARNKAKKAGEMVANFFILNGFSPESFW